MYIIYTIYVLVYFIKIDNVLTHTQQWMPHIWNYHTHLSKRLTFEALLFWSFTCMTIFDK